MSNNIVINLDKECLLKLCDKDPQFEVAIQRAALNYLRNNRLKPLMKNEIVLEIEGFKRDIQKNTESVLKTLGITPTSWMSSSVLLNDSIKEKIKAQIVMEIKVLIEQIVNKEMEKVEEEVCLKIKNWQTSIDSMCKRFITEDTIKEIATKIINQKFK